MKRVLLITVALVLVLIGVVLLRTSSLTSKQLVVKPVEPIALNDSALFGRFSEALCFRTISEQDSMVNRNQELDRFKHFLAIRFPLVHKQLDCFTVNEHALVYRWFGSNPELLPVLLMAHQDVVPAIDSASWEHPPFAGATDGTYIYGRGTLDDKSSVMGLLEAIEYLLSTNRKPKRSVYLAFGFDEETGGSEGAIQEALWFKSKKMEFESVLDEGGTIVQDVVPGVKAPVALVGIAEKGYMTIELSVHTEGGHSSMPPPQSAAGIIAAAVSRLEAEPFPARLQGPLAQMFSYLAPEMDFGSRVAFANLWLLKNAVLSKMSKKNSTNAAIRTTTAVTVLKSGSKDNVLPSEASALINFRLLQGDDSYSVMEHVKQVVNDARIQCKVKGRVKEASPVSDTNSAAFLLLNKTIREVFPEALVAPYQVLAATDAYHFSSLSKQVFRFLPIRLGPEDLARIHGQDERITKKNYLEMVRFYVRYIEHSAVN